MSKYSKKLICDYIMGNEISEYNIDDLENDYIFIKEVIESTSDKKMYNICNDKIKGNYDFVKFLINKFKDDKDFCINAFLKFNELNDNYEDEFEISVMVSNLYEINMDTENKKKLLVHALSRQNYISDLSEVQMALIECDAENMKESYQTGFIFLKEKYKDRTIVVDYIAKNIIEDNLIKNDDFDFEKYIHESYNSIEKIEKVGLTNVILNSIEKFDTYLYEYAQLHIDVISNVKKELIRIHNRFNDFNRLSNEKLIKDIKDYIENYHEESDSELGYLISTLELINFISEDLNIPELKENIEDYIDDDDFYEDDNNEYNTNSEQYNDVNDDKMDEDFCYELTQSIKNTSEYDILKKQVKDFYKNKYVPKKIEIESKITEEPNRGKVLTFNKNKKTVTNI